MPPLILRQPLPRGFAERAYHLGHRFLDRSRLGRWFDFRQRQFLQGPLPDPRLIPRGGAEMFEAGPDLRAWVADLEPDHAADFDRRWKDGARCFVTRHRGDCSGFVWLKAGPAAISADAIGCRWRLPPHAAWIFDAVCRGTCLPLLRFATLHLANGGVTHFFGQIEFGNRLSQRVFRMLGARPAGTIVSLRFGSLWFHLERAATGGFRFLRGPALVWLDRCQAPVASAAMPESARESVEV